MALNKWLRKALVVLLWLMIWAAVARAVGHTLLLPSPLQTLQALTKLMVKGSFWLSVAHSILRIAFGFLLGTGFGILLAVLTSRFVLCRDFFMPLLSVIKATPVASFIILALVWIKADGVPAFATLLIVLPVSWANIAEGIAATDKDLLEMARAFAMPPAKKLSKVYFPSVLPYLRAAVTTGMGMAWKAGVAAEVICTPKNAVGSLLYSAKVYLDTPGLFAATAVVILLSILLEKAVRLLIGGREGRRQNA